MGRCERCGLRRPGSSQRNRDSGSGPPSKKTKIQKREWPPCFQNDTQGAFVLDPQTGLFYDTSSDFFYNPRTKLYFSNKRKVYYEYNEKETDKESRLTSEASVHFKQVEQPDDGDSLITGKTTASLAAFNVDEVRMLGNKTDGKKISISLKTKKIGTSNNNALCKTDDLYPERQSAPTLTKEQKKHKLNMDVWSERGMEKRLAAVEEIVVAAARIQSTDPGDRIPLITTKDGKPVCILCKRKFADLEKLEKHQDLSKLHQYNLSLAQQSHGIVDYRDRAKERRVLFGPPDADQSSSNAHKVVEQLPSLDKARAVDRPDMVRPEDNLSEANVGNQMLQKMGWKSGKKLGRQTGSSEQADNLRQDWERIEVLSQVNSKRVK